MAELLYKDEVYKIVGRCMAVYNELGHGFLEEIYKEALKRELEQYGVPSAREVPLKVMYKGRPLEKEYFADFVCYGKIIVECKAVSRLIPAHVAQTMNYLKATGFKLGILVNFGNSEELEWTRVINSKPRKTVDHPSAPAAQIQNANLCESGESMRMGLDKTGDGAATLSKKISEDSQDS